MAFTEKYVTSAGAGAADGSSLANAWSWATMLTTLAAGERANVNGTITRTTANDAFTNSGTSANPIAIRGINSTADDLESNGRTRGGALVTTNFPVITYTTGQLTLPDYCRAEHLSVTSAADARTVEMSQRNVVRRCKFSNTHSNGSIASAVLIGSPSLLLDCDLSAVTTNTTAKAVSLAGGGLVIGCLVTGVTSGCGGIGGLGQNCRIIGCMIRDAGFGIKPGSDGISVVGCSLRNISGKYFDNNIGNGLILMENCVAWGSGGSSKFYNADTAVVYNNQFNNFVGNMGAADTNEGNWLNRNEVALTADPFTSSTDLTLNATAGGGAAVKAAGYPAYLDGGAWQTQAAGGGLMTRRSYSGGFQ